MKETEYLLREKYIYVSKSRELMLGKLHRMIIDASEDNGYCITSKIINNPKKIPGSLSIIHETDNRNNGVMLVVDVKLPTAMAFKYAATSREWLQFFILSTKSFTRIIVRRKDGITFRTHNYHTKGSSFDDFFLDLTKYFYNSKKSIGMLRAESEHSKPTRYRYIDNIIAEIRKTEKNQRLLFCNTGTPVKRQNLDRITKSKILSCFLVNNVIQLLYRNVNVEEITKLMNYASVLDCN